MIACLRVIDTTLLAIKSYINGACEGYFCGQPSIISLFVSIPQRTNAHGSSTYKRTHNQRMFYLLSLHRNEVFGKLPATSTLSVRY